MDGIARMTSPALLLLVRHQTAPATSKAKPAADRILGWTELSLHPARPQIEAPTAVSRVPHQTAAHRRDLSAGG